jgi:hypothetical protein
LNTIDLLTPTLSSFLGGEGEKRRQRQELPMHSWPQTNFLKLRHFHAMIMA